MHMGESLDNRMGIGCAWGAQKVRMGVCGASPAGLPGWAGEGCALGV